MLRRKVLVPDDYGDCVRTLDCVKRHAGLELDIVPGPVSPAQLAARIADADALILIRERTYITPALLDAAARLKIIAQLGLVRRNLNIDECTRRGIAVAEGPTVSQGTAELTWALIMAARRRIVEEATALRAGRWQTTLGALLHGQTLGLWGYGRVGRLVAGFASAFGMRVLVWGREGSLEAAQQDGHATARDRCELFSTSDVVSLHVRLTPETAGMVGARDFALMKPDALFVNTARAELVRAGALVQALNDGRPGYAAVDVFEREPVPADEPLPAMRNVIALPHMGYVNRQEYETLFGDALASIAEFFAGRPRCIANAGVLEPKR